MKATNRLEMIKTAQKLSREVDELNKMRFGDKEDKERGAMINKKINQKKFQFNLIHAIMRNGGNKNGSESN